MSVLSRILRAGEGRKLDHLRAIVPLVSAWEPTLETEGDDELRGRTAMLRQRAHDGAPLDDLLPEAFAVVREASRRVTGQRHFDVQVMGGAAMHAGFVAEMQTGEGKTLTATLPAYLNSLAGDGVHVVTVNEYLAQRDATLMGRVYGFLGLTTGVIVPNHATSFAMKRAQYMCDITYGTNTEMGFDYLRDNMVMNLADRVHRGFHFAIVDEIDSVLIDEARTPLIIAAEPEQRNVPYSAYAQIVRGLSDELHYEVHDDDYTVAFTDEGIDAVQHALGVENLFAPELQHVVHGVFAALKAHTLFKRDRHYVVLNGEIKIVDEFTGRILEGRKWADGIHQAVEAKEGLPVSGESRTLATVTLQNYFRMYSRLSGMTGTASTAASELMNTYKLDVVTIPTNRPCVRVDHPDLIFHTEEAKFTAMCNDVVARHRTGQPVLIGTTSVDVSEKVSAMLRKRRVAHQVLNAKHHAAEADVIAQAGRKGAVTVATNMAGRGVDILLGGNADALVDQQLRDEGHSVDDPMLEQFLALATGRLDGGRPPESDVLRDRRAELLAKHHRECDRQAELVRALGGLCVIGTERHESERIDRQLRGRAGRQGDPGESVFYVSLEDDVNSLYAADALEWADKTKPPADVPITERWIARDLRNAQVTVEKKNESVRKIVLDYDEVLNEQRRLVYGRRERIVAGLDLKTVALETVSDAVYALTAQHLRDGDEWDLSGFLQSVRELWPTQLTEAELREFGTVEGIDSATIADAERYYDVMEATLGPELMRDVERQMMLQIFDQHWRDHLLALELLQDGISLRAAGQKDPLSEWQRDSFHMFRTMLRRSSLDFVRYVMHVRLVSDDSPLLDNDATQ